MKIYLLKNDGFNEVIFQEGDKWKMTDTAPSGYFENIDLCGETEKVVAQLKEYFLTAELNCFCALPYDENSDFALMAGDNMLYKIK